MFLCINAFFSFAENDYRILDLSQWTKSGTEYSNGTITFKETWQSIRYNFGSSLTTGITGSYYAVEIEFAEPVAYSAAMLWTAKTDPGADRTDHYIPLGATSFNVVIPAGGMAQIGFAYTDAITAGSEPSIKVSSIKLKRNDERKFDLNLSETEAIENGASITYNELAGGYDITGYGWVGWKFGATYGTNDFSKFHIEFEEPTPAELRIWIGDNAIDYGKNIYPAGTQSIDLYITGDFSQIVLASIANNETKTYKIKNIYLNRQIFDYNISGNEATVTNCKVYTGDIEIPSSYIKNGTTYTVTGIGDRAFYQYEDLTTVTIPNTIKTIGNEAFQQCWIESMTIPNSVTSIGDEAFFYCQQLKSLTLSDNLQTIGKNAFAYCTSLKTVTIPNEVKSIGGGAFCYSSAISSILLPDNLEEISDQLFGGCSALTSILIPATVKTIGYYAFGACDGLSEITIPSNVISLSGKVFSSSSNLENILIEGTPSMIDENDREDTFYNIPKTCDVFFYYDNRAGINLSDNVNWHFIDNFSIGNTQYTTYYVDRAYTMPEGVEGGLITAASDDVLSVKWLYKPGETVPAQTALLLKGNVDNYRAILMKEGEGGVAETTNLLKGTLESEEIAAIVGYKYYKLTKDEATDKPRFFYGADDGGAFVNDKRGAYLVISDSEAFAGGYYLEKMITTAIAKVIVDKKEGPQGIYNLSGQRLKDDSINQLERGIYIINGEKVFVK